jgi:chemotaxis protein MotB
MADETIPIYQNEDGQNSGHKRPIIVVRKNRRKKDRGHSSAWKVALADFAVAMMAFFLVLWLVGNASETEKQAISEYFVSPTLAIAPQSGSRSSIIDLGGGVKGVVDDTHGQNAGMIFPPPPVFEIDEQTFEEMASQHEMLRLQDLKQQLEDLVNESDDLKAYKEQLRFEIVPDGLRIEIVDSDGRPMFDSGVADLKGYTRRILTELTKVIEQVPNKITITGHTDSRPFVDYEDYGNWELSADRANAARRALVIAGLAPTKVTRVAGLADSALYDEESPLSPVNRRIAIIVLYEKKARQIKERATVGELLEEIKQQGTMQHDEPEHFEEQVVNEPE